MNKSVSGVKGFRKVLFLMFQERDIHSSHVMAPKISQKGFPVVLHRGNIENQVLIVVLLFLSRKHRVLVGH